MPEIRYARNGDVSLAYQVSGQGPLDVVLVSGFVSHQEVMWDEPAAARLADRIDSFARLIRYDKREQGLSDRLGRPPTLEESMDDLRRSWTRRGPSEPRCSASPRAGRCASCSRPPSRSA